MIIDPVESNTELKTEEEVDGFVNSTTFLEFVEAVLGLLEDERLDTEYAKKMLFEKIKEETDIC